MRSVLFIVSIVTVFNVNAQQIYYSSITSLSSGGLQTVIGSFDPLTCQKNQLFVDTTFTYLEWADLALCPDGNMYAISHDGIYHIDLVADSYQKIVDDPPYPRWERGLLCTKDTILIFGENDILKYDINKGVLTHLGRVSPGLFIWGNIFYYENMIMGSGNNQVIHIDTLDPANSSVYCSIDRPGLLSLMEIAISCDSVAVFALFTTGELYLLNSSNCELTFYCDISNNPAESFQGTQPSFMFMPLDPCLISIDLDFFDVTLPGLNYADTIFCDLPSEFLFSSIDLYSDKQWDSLIIWINNGPSGVALEGLSSPIANLVGSGSDRLKYTVTVPSDISELSLLISSLYIAGAAPAGISSIEIGFAAWADNLHSDTAFAFITLIGRTETSGESDTLALCKNDEPVALSMLISPDASLNGEWLPATTQYSLFNPYLDLSGRFFYVVDDIYCGKDSALFDISIYPIVQYNLQKDYIVCPEDTTIVELEIETESVTWSDGTMGSIIEIFGYDTVSFSVMDEYGCLFNDTVYVSLRDDCVLDELYIPNIFSPDGNNINDTWIILNSENTQFMEVTVFDRWGNALYYEKSLSINWDGTTFNNTPLPVGVYTYKLSVLSINQTTAHKTGSVTILR